MIFLAAYLIIPPAKIPDPDIMPPRNEADMLWKGCPAAMFGRFADMVPIRFDMPDWALEPLTEEMLLKIVPIMPR